MGYYKTHQGRNIRRLRETLGIRQEALADDLGVSQITISGYEEEEVLDELLLQKVSQCLKVPIEAIKHMNEEATINYINTFNDNSANGASFSPYQCTFNPLDKVIELFTEKEQLYKEKQELYERIIKEKNDLIERLLSK